MSEDRFKVLRELSGDLARADAAQALLDEIWSWYGPSGPEGNPGLPYAFLASKEAQKLINHLKMPESLISKLQTYYEFDDSE